MNYSEETEDLEKMIHFKLTKGYNARMLAFAGLSCFPTRTPKERFLSRPCDDNVSEKAPVSI